MTRHLGIVGGGLSGLALAHRAVQAGVRVTLLEASERFGGQLSSVRDDGFVVELGAEGFVARSEAVPALARALAIEDQLIGQLATTSHRWDGEKLVALAPGEAAEALSFQVARADKGSGIRTFMGGMQAVTDAVVRALEGHVHATLQTRSPVRALACAASGSAVLLDGDARASADVVVLATSGASAARILRASAGFGSDVRSAAEHVGAAQTLSSVTVTLAFRAEDVAHPLDGTGFVVAEPFEGFRACTFISSKFSPRVPEGHVSLRVFFRPTAEELHAEVPWAERAARVLGKVLPLRAAPVRAWVSIWPHALPVFTPEHREAVAKLSAALAPHAVFLAGSAFHGSGIDAAVRSANDVAEALGIR